MRILSLLIASAVLLVTVADAKMGYGLWGCPKRNTVALPYDNALNTMIDHRVIYIDNFVNWLINTARLFVSIPDFSCQNIGSFDWDPYWYNTYLYNATTNPFNTKLIYFDSATGTQALYGCLDRNVAGSILDYFTSQG
jgi:hypothetical protein